MKAVLVHVNLWLGLVGGGQVMTSNLAYNRTASIII